MAKKKATAAGEQVEAVRAGYTFTGPSIDLGALVVDGNANADVQVRLPLSMMSRHGLVAGATGTGKTKTLQLIAEQLSAAGVPVFVADVKGDVSGLAAAGDPGGPAEKRMADLGLAFAPRAVPVELLSLGGIGSGVPVRANLSDFGPQLLAKSSARTRRRRRASRSSSTTPTRRACRSSTWPTCVRC